VLLLSSGAYVTLAHHALIGRIRKTTLDGSFVTLVLAILFTYYQAIEYSEASFSLADSIFGTVFFASTGLHGLTLVAPNNNKISIFKPNLLKKNIKFFTKNKESYLMLTTKGNKSFYLNTELLQWLSGFTDAEGNFNISLRNFKENKYNSLVITFQIGLHIDDLPVLKFIQTNLNCGHIAISGNKCNYFVNDQYSLINIILPIFNYVELNSSKYYQFLVFKKAVILIKDKKHLTSEGKLEIIKYYYELKNSNLTSRAKNTKDIIISDY